MDKKTIQEALDTVSLSEQKSIEIVACALVEAAGKKMKSGDACIVIDDPTYPYAGQRGKIKGESANGAFYKVEFQNGTIVEIMSNQLLRA